MANSYNSSTLFHVKDVVAVITGGGSGLGAVAAHTLVQNGAKAVYILGRREDSLQRTKEQSPNPDVIHTIKCDVTSKDDLQAAAQRIKDQSGYCDVLFANSGVISGATKPIEQGLDIKSLQERLWAPDFDDFSNTFRVNIAGAYFSIVAFLELLDEGNKRNVVPQKSQVVLTSSVAGYSRQPAAGFSYGTSKAAVTQLVKQLATTFAPYKIRVNGIAPGFYPSEMTQNMAMMKEADARVEGNVSSSLVPLQRVGTEQDFAGVVLFLASFAGGYIDGNIIITDGGRISQLPNSY